MVSNATSLGRNGLQDWLVQRVTAVILGVYALVVLAYASMIPAQTFNAWHHFYSMGWVKTTTMLAIASFGLHAWVGLWTVTGDYIKCSKIRVALQYGIIAALLMMTFWGIAVVWGI